MQTGYRVSTEYQLQGAGKGLHYVAVSKPESKQADPFARVEALNDENTKKLEEIKNLINQFCSLISKKITIHPINTPITIARILDENRNESVDSLIAEFLKPGNLPFIEITDEVRVFFNKAKDLLQGATFDFLAAHDSLGAQVLCAHGTMFLEEKPRNEDSAFIHSFSFESKSDEALALNQILNEDAESIAQEFSNRLDEELRNSAAGSGTTFIGDLIWLDPDGTLRTLNICVGDSLSYAIDIDLDQKEAKDFVKVTSSTDKACGLGNEQAEPFAELNAQALKRVQGIGAAFAWNQYGASSKGKWYTVISPSEIADERDIVTCTSQELAGVLKAQKFTYRRDNIVLRALEGDRWQISTAPAKRNDKSPNVVRGANMVAAFGDFNEKDQQEKNVLICDPLVATHNQGKPSSSKFLYQCTDGINLPEKRIKEIIQKVVLQAKQDKDFNELLKKDSAAAHAELRKNIKLALLNESIVAGSFDNILQQDIVLGPQIKLGQFIFMGSFDGHGGDQSPRAIRQKGPEILKRVLDRRINIKLRREAPRNADALLAFFKDPLSKENESKFIDFWNKSDLKFDDLIEDIKYQVQGSTKENIEIMRRVYNLAQTETVSQKELSPLFKRGDIRKLEVFADVVMKSKAPGKAVIIKGYKYFYDYLKNNSSESQKLLCNFLKDKEYNELKKIALEIGNKDIGTLMECYGFFVSSDLLARHEKLLAFLNKKRANLNGMIRFVEMLIAHKVQGNAQLKDILSLYQHLINVDNSPAVANNQLTNGLIKDALGPVPEAVEIKAEVKAEENVTTRDLTPKFNWLNDGYSLLTKMVKSSGNEHQSMWIRATRMTIAETFEENANNLSCGDYITCMGAMRDKFKEHRGLASFGRKTATVKQIDLDTKNRLKENREEILRGQLPPAEKVRAVIRNEIAGLEMGIKRAETRSWPFDWLARKYKGRKIAELQKLLADLDDNNMAPALLKAKDDLKGRTGKALEQCLEILPVAAEITALAKLAEGIIKGNPWPREGGNSIFSQVSPAYKAIKKDLMAVLGKDDFRDQLIRSNNDTLALQNILQAKAKESPIIIHELFVVVFTRVKNHHVQSRPEVIAAFNEALEKHGDLRFAKKEDVDSEAKQEMNLKLDEAQHRLALLPD